MHPVTVFGAGIAGLTAAFALARRGVAVTVVDPAGPGAGASGGIVGALAPHVPEAWNEKKAFQFRSLDMAQDFWDAVAGVSGLDPGYARLGRVQPIPDAAALDLARAREVTAAEHWQGRYRWRVAEAAEFGLLPSPTGLVIFDDLSARLHPRQAVRALVAAIVRLGGRVTAEVPERAGVEIHATGAAGLAALSEEFGKTFGTGIKGQAALFAADMRDGPQLFVDGLHVVPHGDGTTAIGSTTEREFTDPATTDAALDALVEKARAAVPALADAEVIERWAGVRPRARSRAPILGPHPSRPDTYIANGGFKIGFGMAPGMAEALADLVLDGRDTIPAAFRLGANL
ncbi:FAD-dependent oxidoreductase [Rhodobacterales bacterium HKCCE2091]|nr:FAD-dependent oxidoreductase [Rhodobacterales bacterium HKCCE2091]